MRLPRNVLSGPGAAPWHWTRAFAGAAAVGSAVLALLIASLVTTSSVRADQGLAHECFANDLGRRIPACTELLDTPGLDPATRASAYAMRALSLSLLQQYKDAIADYDKALAIRPNYPVALNNRAWAHFRMGNNASAWPDVTASLELDPWSPHAFDTRAHLHHTEGKAADAFADYERAMQFGGKTMIKLYQCGLQAHGHYIGPLNGLMSDAMLSGLKACTEDLKCDPLPPDEECKLPLS